MSIDLKALIGKLNEPCRRALEQAAGLTLSRTNYNVEIEHWLLKLIEIADAAKRKPRVRRMSAGPCKSYPCHHRRRSFQAAFISGRPPRVGGPNPFRRAESLAGSRR